MDEVPFIHGVVRKDGQQVTTCMVCYWWKVGFAAILDLWEKDHVVALHGSAVPILGAA